MRRVYGISVASWTVFEENPAPGTPYSLTATGDGLTAVCGEPPDDDRYIRHYEIGAGFTDVPRKACPDFTGSYLAFDGKHLILTQWYKRRVLFLNRDFDVAHSVEAQHEICGAAFADGAVYLVTTDDECTDDYWLSRVGEVDGRQTSFDVARIPFKARSLAWDGSQFWTNHRERNEIVSFDFPG